MAKTVKKNTALKKATPHCPYCDVELVAMNLPFCQACQITIIYCPHCGKPLPKNNKICPSCGTKVKS
jgi:predicted amidophosphoribosyltransferase